MSNEIHKKGIHDPEKLEIGKDYAIVICDWRGEPEYKFIQKLTGFMDNNRTAMFGSVGFPLVVEYGKSERHPVETIILEVDEPLIATLKQIGGRRRKCRGTKKARRNRRRPSRKN